MCRHCGIEIEMSDKESKWLPYSLTTGKIHDCPKRRMT
jgi:hypothetical protein